ncbi:TPA: hypothetical protein DCZ81_00085 [Candidatus Collierbacteria bacterium]|nr:hypothetical protein [Candidatus Collierbacteria bacterium]
MSNKKDQSQFKSTISFMREQLKGLKPIDIDKRLASMEKELKGLKPIDIDKRLASMEKELKAVEKKLIKLKKNDDTIIRFFDHEVMNTKKRVDRLEDHLHLSSLRGV